MKTCSTEGCGRPHHAHGLCRICWDKTRTTRAARAKKEFPERYAYNPRREIQIENGHVLIGSDAHYFPEIISPGHRAFVQACCDFKPKVVILNGDVFDGSRISRFPPIGWKHMPDVVEELQAVQERTTEILDASPRAEHIWTLGNHDARFETKLATVAPEFRGVKGVSLKHHFPLWEPTWSVWGLDDLVVKHRYKGGANAPRNNAIFSGKTLITGHLHSQQVTPYSDYRGTRWGVDSGTLAEPYGPQFTDYTEDNPLDWRQGFVILTYHKGRLLCPETARIVDSKYLEFRGSLKRV